MSETRKIIIDANIWNWYLNQKSPNHEFVKTFVNEIIAQPNVQIYLNSFLVLEIFHYLIKKLGPIQGKQKTIRLLEFDFIKVASFNTFEDLMQILEELVKYGSHTTIGGRDATILVTMKQNQINEIISHDSAFTKVEGIKILDPVK